MRLPMVPLRLCLTVWAWGGGDAPDRIAYKIGPLVDERLVFEINKRVVKFVGRQVRAIHRKLGLRHESFFLKAAFDPGEDFQDRGVEGGVFHFCPPLVAAVKAVAMALSSVSTRPLVSESFSMSGSIRL